MALETDRRKLEIPRGAVKAPFPNIVRPMLASVGVPFSDPAWLYELKWDGLRVLASCRGGRLALTSRLGNPLTEQFPELTSLPRSVAASEFILDGEVVVLDEKGVPDFPKLQPRMRASGAAAARLSRTAPVTYYVFDLLYLDGWDLRPLPLHQRRRLLAEVLKPEGAVRISDTVEERGEDLFKLAVDSGLEGIVAKKRDSPYEAKRSRHWLKIKTANTVDCVICGLTAPKGGRSAFGSLVLGMYEAGRLVHVGNVGTGFSEKQLKEMERRFEPLFQEEPAVDRPPRLPGRVRWMRPEEVCEVSFREWTREGHLRHPLFVRMRPDASPLDCTRGEVPASSAAMAVRAPLVPSDSPKEIAVRVEGRVLKLSIRTRG